MMGTSNLNLQYNIAILLNQFSEGMTTLLQQKELNETDRKNFEQTAQLVETVAKRFLENGQQAIELENKNHLFKIEHLKSTVELLLAAKEKQFHLAREEYTQLREAAEFLKQNLAHLPNHQGELLTFDRKEICLKSTHPHFRGREDLFNRIQHVLLKHQPVVLYGPPGIGKSEAAIAFANRELEKKTYSLIWTLDCATTEQREQSYRNLSDALGLPVLKDDTAEAIHKRVHRRLEQLDQKWLLIFDNLDQPIELPQRGGDILITTISQDIFLLYSPLEVLPFSENESIVLLKDLTHEEESEEMYLLVKLLGGYLLVLGQVASYIYLNKMTIASYIKEKIFSDSRALKPSERYQRTLDQVLPDIAKQLSPLAQDWLGICAYFNPDKISKSLIKSWLELFHTEIHDPKKMADEIFISLVNHGFLRFHAETQALSMHRVFQHFFKKEGFYPQVLQLVLKMAETSQLEQPVMLINETSLTDEWMRRAFSNELSLSDEWMQHAFSLTEDELFKTIEEKMKRLFLTFMGHRYKLECNFSQAIKSYQQALKIDNELTPLHKAAFYHQLGFCFACQKNLKEAFEQHEQALKIRELVLDHNHPCIAHSLIYLAHNLIQQNKVTQAIEKFEQVLKIQESSLGQDHPEVAKTLHDIAHCLSNQGKNDEALIHCKKALNIQKKGLNLQHPDVGRSYTTMAKVFFLQQQYAKSIIKYTKAFNILEPALGSNHFGCSEVFEGLARCFVRQGRYEDAISKFKQALKGWEISFGFNHSVTAEIINNICLVYLMYGDSFASQKKHQEALEKYQQGLDYITSLSCSAPPTLMSLLYHMGICLETQGKSKKATEKYMQALAIKADAPILQPLRDRLKAVDLNLKRGCETSCLVS